MQFEKWQALGNDYIIIERSSLTFELSEQRIQRICDYHLGIGGDGILLLEASEKAGFVASLRIFNPDGSEAELSGNGAREAIMYLYRRGWTDAKTFSIDTVAGEIRPTIIDDTTCKVDMGRAKLKSKDYPSGNNEGGGIIKTTHGEWRFQHVSIGNPQCAIFVDSLEELNALDLPLIGPDLEHNELFPNRSNISFSCELEPGTLRTRIFERGVGETMSSGTGATGAAVAYVLRGADGNVTVKLDGGELTAEITEDLHVNLTGWAVPIYVGEFSSDFIKTLEGIDE